MPSNYGTKTVTTNATLIIAANPQRRNLTIVPVDGDIYIGPDSSITTANGIPLWGGSIRDQDKVPEGYTGDVYGIAGSSIDVRYWETYT